MNKLLFIFLFISLVKYSFTWNAFGHMLVSEIAMQQSNPETFALVNNMFHIYHQFYPNYSGYLSGATWPDHIRSLNLEEFTDWHFIDRPYNPENLNNIHNASKINVVTILNEIMSTFRRKTDEWGSGMMIRYLFHLVGDIHQPFHNINFFSSKFPHGDKGGNKYHFECIWNNKIHKIQMHEFWDSCGELYYHQFKFPLSERSKLMIRGIAMNLLREIQIKPNMTSNFKNWSETSYNLAIEYGYNLVEPFSLAPKNYVNIVRKVCKKQIVKAGLRLASIINNLF